MAIHMVTCRVCKEKFDTNDQSIDWIMPSRNWYYHKKCYEQWISAVSQDANFSDDEWAMFIYDYLKHDVHLDYDYHMIEAQRKKMLRENKMTSKGIYFALRYFYDVKHGDKEKAHGGIGIVPYVYNESAKYWISREKRNRGIIQQITKQMADNLINPQRVVGKRTEQKKAQQTDWDAVEGLFDEEE